MPAFRLIPTTRADTYGYVWDGKITRADVEHVLGPIRQELEAHISVRVLARIANMGGFQPAVLLQSALFRVKLLGMRKIERYAIVGGPSWIPKYVAVVKRFSDIDIRYFPLERESDAWTWLEARPKGETTSVAQAIPTSSIN